jgi:Acetyltransferase (GNAT) domain
MTETGAEDRLPGYCHPGYAESLVEFGTPRRLPHCGGWVLARPIPGSPYRDAMGLYPLFCCNDWSRLRTDLDELQSEFVAISAVTDPFGRFDPKDLQSNFTDRFMPFKSHFVADLRRSPAQYVSDHHRTYARQALRAVKVELCTDPAQYLDVWIGLYDVLISRHQLKGIKRFSRDAFSRQLTVPGLVMLRAAHDGETVGAHLWYVQDDVVHSHLAASSARGYELMASYALYWYAIEAFSDVARWLNFGAAAGLDGESEDGLTKFKKGWATEARTAYFCGRILQREKYQEAAAVRGASDSSYFPAYRQGEFS